MPPSLDQAVGNAHVYNVRIAGNPVHQPNVALPELKLHMQHNHAASPLLILVPLIVYKLK